MEERHPVGEKFTTAVMASSDATMTKDASEAPSTSSHVERIRKDRTRINIDALLEQIEEKKHAYVEIRRKLQMLGSDIKEDDRFMHELDEASIMDIPPGDRTNQQAVLNVIMVAAECAPYSKTGGLGDVTGSLPKYLAAKGHHVTIVTPRYEPYPDATFTGISTNCHIFGQNHEVQFYHLTKDGVDIVFVDHPCYHHWRHDIYGGDQHDVTFRCALLSKAALDVPHCLTRTQASAINDPIFIANDWHTALLPVYLKAHHQDHGRQRSARSVLVIHNIAFQGRGPVEDLNSLDLPLEYRSALMHGDPVSGMHMNILKGALIHADRIVAVSPEYAWECQTLKGGCGLDDIVREQSWKLSGIINGIDTDIWNPSTDLYLKNDGYVNYDVTTLHNKAICKRALQSELGLPINPTIPVVSFIGRLDDQKGIDLIEGNIDWLMNQDVQLMTLGSGRSDLEASLRSMASHYPSQCHSHIGFSIPLAHRIIAGSDLLLMPSHFEPCGLTQLYAFAYGSVPIVHATGGLRDTVIPYDPSSDSGNGWTFDSATTEGLHSALDHALMTYHNAPDAFKRLQIRGMEQPLSWHRAADAYIATLLEARNQE